MNNTWLSRKIKGPNAEGDPVKKKNSKGVKPYVTYDRDDPRIQAYSDSLDAHLLTNYFEKEFMANRGYNLYNTFKTKSANIVPANTPSLTTSKSWPYDYYASQTKMKPSRIISSNNKTVKEFPLYDKPKQKVMLQSLEKMPIGKLKSKSTTPKKLKSRENMKMLTQTVMGTSGKQEPAYQYKKRKGLSDEQMYRSFPGLKPNKTK